MRLYGTPYDRIIGYAVRGSFPISGQWTSGRLDSPQRTRRTQRLLLFWALPESRISFLLSRPPIHPFTDSPCWAGSTGWHSGGTASGSERREGAHAAPHLGRPTTPSASVDSGDQSTRGARRCSAHVTSWHPVLTSPRCRSPRDRPPAEALNAALDSAEQIPRTMEWCRGLRGFRGEGFPAARSRSRYLHRAHRSMVPVDSGFVSHNRTSDLGFEIIGCFGLGAHLNEDGSVRRSIEQSES